MSNYFDRIASAQQETNGAHESASDSAQPLPEQESSAETACTPVEVKETVQELLKHGYLEEARKSASFRQAVIHQQAIGAALEPLNLELKLDEHRGVAYLKVAQEATQSIDEQEAWSHPLVRRQRMTLEQSLLIAILRQAFMRHEQESGVGQSAAKVSVDDLQPQFFTYFQDSGSDAKNESRLLNLLDQLKSYGIISEVDKRQEITIRPLIAHLANPESLTALLTVLEEQAQDEATDEEAAPEASISETVNSEESR